MTIGRIKEGDVVRCDVRGQRFWGVAVQAGGTQRGALMVSPIGRGVLPTTTVKARQVVGHWHRRAGSVV